MDSPAMPNVSNAEGGSAVTSAPKPRAVRAMLARGAACDLCRSRKVRCDGGRPICGQCTKSAKGKTENCNCVYEGAGTVAKGAPPAPRRVKSDGDGSNPVEKRPREVDVNEEEGSKRKAPAGGQRVETLVDRITELERRLQLQAQSHPPFDGAPPPPSYPLPTAIARPLTSASSYPPPAGFATSTYSVPGPAWPPMPSEIRTAPLAQSLAPVPDLAPGDFTAASFTGSSYPPRTAPPSTIPSGMPDFFDSSASGMQSTSPVDFTANDFTNSSSTATSARFNTSSGYQTSPSVGPASVVASPADSLGLDATFLQILYPAWPSSLPLPSIVSHLVRTFLRRATIPATMFNKPRFLASLDLPPSATGFPETALLHAICAYAVDLISVDELNVRDERGRMYWDSAKGPKEYHSACAKKAIEVGLLSSHGNNLQILQATILCCYSAYHAADFCSLWVFSGIATRLCTPLGLNHLPAYNYTDNTPAQRCDWSGRIRMTPASVTNTLLPPCRDQDEHYERCVTFWAAFAIDRHASAATDWSTSIDEQDISTHLPCYSNVPLPELAVDPAAGQIHSLSLKDPKFLLETAAPIGSLGLYIKGNVLLGRVINYVQRLPRNIVMPAGESCLTMKETMMKEPAFLELDYTLSKFRTTVSANFIDAGNHVDGYLASSFALPHVATLLLHEIFTDRHDRGPNSSLERCLTSAKIIVNSTYFLFESSSDLAGIDPFLPFTWSVVGRALVRDLAVRRFWGDKEGEDSARQLAEDCLAFVENCNKSEVGITVVLAKTLRALLKNPNLVLPPDMTFDGETMRDPREQLFAEDSRA